MYLPPAFEQMSVDAIRKLIEQNPLATLISNSESGLVGNHIPMQFVPDGATYGTLVAHVARENPLWRDVTNEQEVLAIFHGVDAYISPSWYPSKQPSGRVVPTWNYAVVHAYGQLRAVDDVSWIRSQVSHFTERLESSLPHPWSVNDAPTDFVDKLLKNVVGIELKITRLIGKWKISQNRSTEDREGVVRGLCTQNDQSAKHMANMIKDWSSN